MLSSLAQSVLEGSFVSCTLTFHRLSQRDNSDGFFIRFCKNNHYHATSERTNTNPTVFAVVVPGVECGKHGSLKNLFGISEIQPMFFDVEPVFGFVPLELHTLILALRDAG